MKEKFGRIKKWIQGHKKHVVGIGLVILLILGTIGIGVFSNSNKVTAEISTNKKVSTTKNDSTNKKENSEAEDKKEKEKATEDKSEEKKDAADTKEDEDKKSATETKQTTATNTTNTASTGNDTATTPSSSPSGSSSGGSNQPTYTPTTPPEETTPPHTHNWQPQYESQETWIDTSGEVVVPIKRCSICGEEIVEAPGDHLKAHALAGEGVGTWYSDTKTEWKEDGYWGKQDVLTGYTCSCGATKGL